MLGNPCQSNWPGDGFREYVVASLPQLELLDGHNIHKSDRIKALQVFAERQQYVRKRAADVQTGKAREAAEAKQREQQQAEAKAHEDNVVEVSNHEVTDISASTEGSSDGMAVETLRQEKQSVFQSDEKVPYTPHSRREMYMELAEQKEADEARKRENQPRERDSGAEHAQALQTARRQEQTDAPLRQCNEGKWDFRLVDEVADVVLEVDLPRFLDTSLVDVDVHPSYVSIVAKNKLLRLRFSELVHSDAGTAERSKVTGTLRLTLPKAHVSETQKLRAQLQRESQAAEEKAKNQCRFNRPGSKNAISSTSRTRMTTAKAKLSDEVASCPLDCWYPSLTTQSTLTPIVLLLSQVLGAAVAAHQCEEQAHRRHDINGAVKLRGLVQRAEMAPSASSDNQVGNDGGVLPRMTPLFTKPASSGDPTVDSDDDDAPPLLH